jgi:flagellar protein FlaJ
MRLGLEATQNFDPGSLINTEVYNIPLIEFLLVAVILFSAMLSALMIRTIDGGHKANSYLHFVLLSWIGAIIAVVTKVMVSSFLSI